MHCKILLNTTKKTKRSYYNGELFTSKNKIKSIWNIVEDVTDRKSVLIPSYLE